MKQIGIVVIGIVVWCMAVSATAAPQAFEFARKVGQRNNTYCVYDTEAERWKPAKRRIVDDETLYVVQRRPKKRAKNYSKKKKKFKSHKRKCNQQQSPFSASLDKLPGTGDVISEIESLESEAVSGTPPSYTDITDATALALYWREVDDENVIEGLRSGSPTEDQCNEFFTGSSDGDSAGLVACEANINALRAIVKPLEAGIAACYLRNLATQENADGGGISLVRGSSYPGGSVENLYSPPSRGEGRVVQMNLTGGDNGDQTIFVKVFSEATNLSNGNQYRVVLWFCDADGSSPYGLDDIAVSTTNIFSASSKGLRDGAVDVSLTGTLVQDEEGEFEFDTEQPTEAEITFVSEEAGVAAGYDISVVNGMITLKTHEVYSGSGLVQKTLSLLGYTGDAEDLAMTDGAARFLTTQSDTVVGSGVSAFEYRDDRYATTVTGEKLTTAQAADFSSDSFYQEDPEVDLTISGYSCSAEADVTVTIDMTAETMQAVSEECEGIVPQNTAFCESDALDEAEESFFENCS